MFSVLLFPVSKKNYYKFVFRFESKLKRKDIYIYMYQSDFYQYVISFIFFLLHNLSYTIKLNVKYNLCTVVQIKMLKYDNFLYMLNKIFS